MSSLHKFDIPLNAKKKHTCTSCLIQATSLHFSKGYRVLYSWVTAGISYKSTVRQCSRVYVKLECIVCTRAAQVLVHVLSTTDAHAGGVYSFN